MAKVTIKDISKIYPPTSAKGNQTEALEELSLQVSDGEFVAFFGPNACGKTTLLNCVAGVISIDSGSISIDGKKPRDAKIGYIFQNHLETLLPWARVVDNIAYPLYLHGVSRRDRHIRVHKLLETMNISIPLDVWPTQLSGGQQQLVTIARALIYEPDLMLFDEPFSALDIDSRLQMHAKLQDIWNKTKATILFVSHELDEALLLADRVVMLSKGPARILDIIEIPFDRPRNQRLLEEEDFSRIRRRALRIFRKAVTK